MTSPDQPMSGSVPTPAPAAQPDRATSGGAGMLASNAERDAAAQRLQVAFAESRLTDDEFDHRIRAALTARTTAELDRLTADLPSASQVQIVTGRKPGRFAVVYKGSISRSGRWPVPKHLLFGVYKGGGRIDLRAAELTAKVTTIRAIAYKSNTEIVVPPGVRIELGGLGVSADTDSGPDADLRHDPDTPVVRIKGLGYKGTILVATRTPVPHAPGLSPGPGQTPLPLT
ncbi:MAG TPA: DUF1707 domain-containing protein [Streptosporangiaceae bacterium]|nr:DUF1707 domain-containing protein [Streptosporangiaceae bacterium]